MGMDINKSGNHDTVSGVYLLMCRLCQIPDSNNAITNNTDIHSPTRMPSAIYHQSTRYFQVIYHESSSTTPIHESQPGSEAQLRWVFTAHFPQQFIELLKELLERIDTEERIFD